MDPSLTEAARIASTCAALSRGFTLIEMMIVVAIIAILVSILVPNFVRARAQGQTSACESNLKEIATAIELFQTDNDHYPSSGTVNSNNAELSPYLKQTPVDPAAGPGNTTRLPLPAAIRDRRSTRSFARGRTIPERCRTSRRTRSSRTSSIRRRPVWQRPTNDGRMASGSGLRRRHCEQRRSVRRSEISGCSQPVHRHLGNTPMAPSRRVRCGVSLSYVAACSAGGAIARMGLHSVEIYALLAIACVAVGVGGSHARMRAKSTEGRAPCGIAFFWGGVAGIVGSPCCGPLVALTVFGWSTAGRDPLVPAAFALGHAAPLVGFGNRIHAFREVAAISMAGRSDGNGRGRSSNRVGRLLRDTGVSALHPASPNRARCGGRCRFRSAAARTNGGCARRSRRRVSLPFGFESGAAILSPRAAI